MPIIATIGSTGRVQIWINGSVVVTNTAMTYKGTNKSYTNTYVGALTDAEAAATY